MASYKYKPGFCKDCDANRKLETKACNHLLHFFMCCVTMGFWLIVWACVSWSGGKWNCHECGSNRVQHKRKHKND